MQKWLLIFIATLFCMCYATALAQEGGQVVVPSIVHIFSVTTDQTYRNLDTIPTVPPGTHVTIKYNAIDFKNAPGKWRYRCRIKEIDSDWRRPTKATSFGYTFQKAGMYTLEVQAIDSNLNFSEPASLEIRILSPPFYTHTGFIIGSILAAFLIPTVIYVFLLTQQKKKAFEPIPNPYIAGNPIRSKEMFFGRRNDFEFIRAKLATGQTGLVIIFAGERRSGKTSILFQILNGELGERFVPVLLDMQAMTVDSEAEFLEKIASEINLALGEQLELTPTTFREENPTRTFERFIAQAMEAMDGKALLLMFDEYELIEAKINAGVLSSDIITFFDSLLEAYIRLSLIFTGSQHLEQRNLSYWYTLMGKSLYRRISFLSERDALRLITEPVREQVVYPRGIPKSIVRLTAGQPFYTQVICQNLVDRLNESRRNRVRKGEVEVVVQELVDNP
nr:hypothetical protein [bacterium]